MINTDRLDRIRVVEDHTSETSAELPLEQQGTKVLAELTDAAGESLLPLGDSSAAEQLPRTQATSQATPAVATPTPSRRQLLVEDAADLFYLRAMSNILQAAEQPGLDVEWTIVPIGGIENIPTYLTQEGNVESRVALLASTRRHDQEVLNAFQARQLIESDHLRTMSVFAATQEAAIEDLFDVVFYTNLVNAAYRGYLSQPISPPSLNSASVRLRDRVMDYLAEHPLQGGINFNHRRPARLFADNTERLANEISPQTRDRFARLFAWLSGLP